MITFLTTVFSSILSGGATGLLGVVFQRIADYKNRQLDLQLDKQRGELELAKRDKDAAIMREEWAGRTQVAQIEGDATKDAAESAAFAASLSGEPKRYADGKMTTAQTWLMVALDFIRGIVRPGLTIYLCVLTTLVYLQARELLAGQAMSATEALELVKMIVGTVLYLTTTCVLWWFGTRNKAPQPGQK